MIQRSLGDVIASELEVDKEKEEGRRLLAEAFRVFLPLPDEVLESVFRGWLDGSFRGLGPKRFPSRAHARLARGLLNKRWRGKLQWSRRNLCRGRPGMQETRQEALCGPLATAGRRGPWT